MVQSGKSRRLFIVAKAFHRSNMFFHYGDHFFFIRHGHFFFEQQLNEKGAARGEAFPSQILLKFLVFHFHSPILLPESHSRPGQ